MVLESYAPWDPMSRKFAGLLDLGLHSVCRQITTWASAGDFTARPVLSGTPGQSIDNSARRITERLAWQHLSTECVVGELVIMQVGESADWRRLLRTSCGRKARNKADAA